MAATKPAYDEATLARWSAALEGKEPEEILRWVRLAVGTRSGHAPPDLKRYGERVIPLELASPPVSSNEVRARIRAGERFDDLVPSDVALLIEERGLYRNGG